LYYEHVCSLTSWTDMQYACARLKPRRWKQEEQEWW